MCVVCFQPECEQSTGGSRPAPGVIPLRPLPGRSTYMGYGDWAMHPDEARFFLHRGYAVVDGEKQRVRFMHNYAYCAIVRVEGTNTNAMQNMWTINAERKQAAA